MADITQRKSLTTTGGPGRAPNRAMLRAVGFTDDDFAKPMIGVASLFRDITPCNAHLDRLARKGQRRASAPRGGVPQIFGAPTVSDGIMMGHKGMRYSLVSREVIADSIEIVCRGDEPRRPARLRRLRQEHARLRHGDGPAQRPQRLRLRRQHPARRRARAARTSTSSRIFEAVGQFQAGKLDAEGARTRSSARAAPATARAAACTPPTRWPAPSRRWACRCPTTRSNPAVSAAKEREAFLAGQAVVRLHREEHPAARHHHAQVAGERLHLRARAGRLDQRGAAPDGHRPRGRGASGRWPTSTASARRCRTSPT